MAGIAAPNLVTNTDDTAAQTAREAEHAAIGENATPFIDTPGDGTFADPYLGLNRAGGCSPGVGINTGEVLQTAAEVAAGPERFASWTEEDQNEAARTPQDSAILGNGGSVLRVGNVATTWDKSQLLYTDNGAASSGGVEGNPTLPITITEGADINDTANLVITDTAAADGAVMDVGGTGAINDTGDTVGIGDLVWGKVPVA